MQVRTKQARHYAIIQNGVSHSDKRKLNDAEIETAEPQVKRQCIRFEDLPEEIIEMIFQYLDSASLLKATKVSRLWNCVISGNSKVMKKLPLFFYSKMITQHAIWTAVFEFHKVPEKFTRSYQSIHFHRIESVPICFLRKLKNVGQSVKFVTINGCHFNERSFAYLMQCFPNVETLYLGMSFKKFPYLRIVEQAVLPKLKKIRCIGYSVEVSWLAYQFIMILSNLLCSSCRISSSATSHNC